MSKKRKRSVVEENREELVVGYRAILPAETKLPYRDSNKKKRAHERETDPKEKKKKLANI